MPSWARCWRKACWPPSSACCSTAGTAAMSTPAADRHPPAARRPGARTHGAAAVANDRLLGEMDERQRARAAAPLQDELVQASKLALLGQVAAGVAHEINQPVAAIRSYADNAAEFLRRQDPETARENLESIASLTERIGHITGELRAFSRKASTQVAPISLGAALDGGCCWPARARRAWRCIGRPPARMRGAGRPHPAGTGAGQSAAERAGRAGRSAGASPWPCATRASGCSSISMTTDRA